MRASGRRGFRAALCDCAFVCLLNGCVVETVPEDDDDWDDDDDTVEIETIGPPGHGEDGDGEEGDALGDAGEPEPGGASGSGGSNDPAVPHSGSTGSCCSAHPGIGCADPYIESCVCGIDPSCCTESWDVTCAQRAAGLCAAC